MKRVDFLSAKTPGRDLVRLFGIAVAVLLGGVSDAAAQTAAQLEVGSRVRVTAPSHGLHEAVGTVEEISNGSLSIRLEQWSSAASEPAETRGRRTRTLERSSITEMDLYLGRTSRSLDGLVIGALGGAVFGAGISAATWTEPKGTGLCMFVCSRGEAAELGAMVFGVLGGGVGLLLGSVTKVDVWRSVASEAAGLSVAPILGPGRSGSVRIGLTVGAP